MGADEIIVQGNAAVYYAGDMSKQRFLQDEMPVLRAREHLPAVCLDLDGVLNPYRTKAEGFASHVVHMPASDLPDFPFVRGHGRKDLKVPVLVSATHAAWIADLRERVDVYWSTTWETAANLHYAPCWESRRWR
jgi:hypothetical protein